jgi:hypothetical protein
MKVLHKIMSEKDNDSSIEFFSTEVFKFVRNIISHFPLFNSWNEVWISKSLVNWNKTGQSIDKFLKNNAGREPLGFAYKNDGDAKEKFPTMVDINFPKKYNEKTIIYLKDIISEKEGIIFSISLMNFLVKGQKSVLKTLDSDSLRRAVQSPKNNSDNVKKAFKEGRKGE